jgi:hypothetical protein
MNDTSSEQRADVSSLLTPADTLNQRWLRETTTSSFPFNEFRLYGLPDSLKTFVDLDTSCWNMEDTNKARLIWTSENSFVLIGHASWGSILGPLGYRKFLFELRLPSGSHTISICIYSSQIENAMSCLDFLVGLQDDHFDTMELCEDCTAGRRLCPLTCRLLEKVLLQNAKRKNSFDSMTFTPDQSRTLATSGTRTVIDLNCCDFLDDGEAFLEALAARADPQTGLSELNIRYMLPFAEGILVSLCLRMLKRFALSLIHLHSDEACRAMSDAELQYLELRWCELADGGAALVESVRVGRGAKGLGIYSFTEGNDGYDEDEEEDYGSFDSSERFVSFLNALRGNTYLERLVLSGFDLREEGIMHVLAAALIENKGLVHLGLQYCRLDEDGFCEFLRAISAHPSLRTLDLSFRDLDMDKTTATKALAEMLSVNNELEGIRCRHDDGYDSPFDPASWAALVIPILECNIYRKRFPAIQEIRPPSTLAAVLASALAHVSNKPSPAFMLLRENVDIAKTIEKDLFSDSDALSQQAMLPEKSLEEIKQLKAAILELKSELSAKEKKLKQIEGENAEQAA